MRVAPKVFFLVLLSVLIAIPAGAFPLARKIETLRKKPWFQPIEHVALGVGVQIAVEKAGGSPRAGFVATALVAGFKEGSDALSGRDLKKSAAVDAIEIVAGSGVVISGAIAARK